MSGLEDEHPANKRAKNQLKVSKLIDIFATVVGGYSYRAV